MERTIQIRCKNNGALISTTEGAALIDIFNEQKGQMDIVPVSAKVNNVVQGLHFRVYHNCDVEFLDITNPSGLRAYVRSLTFVLCAAFESLFPGGKILVENPVSKGLYCSLRIGRELTLEDVTALKKRMQEIIDADMPIYRVMQPTDQAIEHFTAKGLTSKVKLQKTIGQLYTFYYRLGDTIDYFYSSLLPSTGGLKMFDVVKYYDGVLLRFPDSSNTTQLGDIVKQKKMFEIFQEHHRWQEILGLSTVGELNEVVLSGDSAELINVSEALQEKKISRIADEIVGRESVKVVLISGPSSSGKTTFSKRLSVQLMACGKRPFPISLDDYFVNREMTPLDANGEYDFESLYALDLDYFNEQLAQLLAGEEVELPRFNFQTGKREQSGKHVKLDENMILILEGIHALNPDLTPQIPRENKYMIYASALTTIMLDDHNYIPTSDNRLLRRIIRDYKYRGYSAQDTISRWPSVRAGENKWIFPYQENADAMFNSALLFEIAVIRDMVRPILERVPQNCPEYSEAHRLLHFLGYFVPLTIDQVPPTSLLREFLGGSSFKY